MLKARPHISIVVVAHKMAREIPRTLTTLQPPFQKGCESLRIEVVLMESNSDDLAHIDLPQAGLQALRQAQVQTKHPTPVEAMNQGIQLARGRVIAVMIDGARMLSPGAIRLAYELTHARPQCVAYTLSAHLGTATQDISVAQGYNQYAEDELLETVDWRKDGYDLFDISVPANSSRNGFLGDIHESNFLAAQSATARSVLPLDNRFITPGGGFANLDLLRRIHANNALEPTVMLGEATFHQFHGGVATNVTPEQRPMAAFKAEYLAIRGQEYSPVQNCIHYTGSMTPQARHFQNRIHER